MKRSIVMILIALSINTVRASDFFSALKEEASKLKEHAKKASAAFTPTESASRAFIDDKDFLPPRGCWFEFDSQNLALWLRARPVMRGNVDLDILFSERHGVLIFEAHSKELPSSIAMTKKPFDAPSISTPGKNLSFLHDSTFRGAQVIDFNDPKTKNSVMSLHLDFGDTDSYIYCLRLESARKAQLLPCSSILKVHFCQVNEPINAKNIGIEKTGPLPDKYAIIMHLTKLEEPTKRDLAAEKKIQELTEKQASIENRLKPFTEPMSGSKISAFDVLLTAVSKALPIDKNKLTQDEYGALGFIKTDKILQPYQVTSQLDKLEQLLDAQPMGKPRFIVEVAIQLKEPDKSARALAEQAMNLLYTAHEILLQPHAKLLK